MDYNQDDEEVKLTEQDLMSEERRSERSSSFRDSILSEISNDIISMS